MGGVGFGAYLRDRRVANSPAVTKSAKTAISGNAINTKAKNNDMVCSLRSNARSFTSYIRFVKRREWPEAAALWLAGWGPFPRERHGARTLADHAAARARMTLARLTFNCRASSGTVASFATFCATHSRCFSVNALGRPNFFPSDRARD